MPAHRAVSAFFVLLSGIVLSAGGIGAQQTNVAHMHVGHIVDAFPQTPNGEGLLPTARAEADIAIQHAGLAAREASNLEMMKTHAGHVLHAVDPTRAESGPGRGFGVKRAADAIAQHIGLAAAADGASQNVQTHAMHVAASARTVSQRADEVAELAARVQAATNASDAAALVQEMQTVAQQLVTGRDADGNGQVGWQEGEGGLEQVEQHMGFLTAGEGLD